MNSNSQALRTGRKAAAELFRAACSENEPKDAAQCLLEMAVHATSLVEDAALVYPAAFSKASKAYPFFPILLASKDGRDTKQKLERIGSLPVAENRPFKRLSGQARNDNLRSWIEYCHDEFQKIRRRTTAEHINKNFESEIRNLAKMSKHSARQWAIVMARYSAAGPGGTELPGLLSINLSKETAKKRQRKQVRLKKAFGGIRLTEIPRNLPERQISKWSGQSRLVSHSGNVEQGRELDAIEATKFTARIKHMESTPQTQADLLSAIVDCY